MDAILKTAFFFLYENCCIMIPVSLTFASRGPVNNDSSLMWIMAKHQTGDQPLYEPKMA